MSSSEEILAECVRKFSVLYDKNKTDYKDKVIVNNAWKQVVEESDIELQRESKTPIQELEKTFC